MSDRICVMAEGNIRQIGSPSDIYERPQNRFVADFMGRSNLLDASLRGSENGHTMVDVGELVLRSSQQGGPSSGDAVVMIRPERIVMQRAGGGNRTVNGTVESAVYLGSVMHYEVALSSGQTLQVTSQIEADYARQHFDKDEPVEILIPPEAVYILTEA